jgi:DNA-binding NtrC family response regulator
MNMHFLPISGLGALEQNTMSRTDARHPHFSDPFLGESAAIRSLADSAKRAALSDSPVVIEGERGTGKKLLAFWLYEHGQHASQPLFELNCGSLLRRRPEIEHKNDLLEKREQPAAGFPGLADGGTIVLAEIQDADLRTQARLLRMLGRDASEMPTNGKSRRGIRFITTAQEGLAALVQAKRLRADLYSRISGPILHVPPLRERRSDVPMLAVQMLASLAKQFGNRDFDLTRRALQVLQDYPWPGNIHELRIVLERSVLLARSTLLTATDLHVGERMGTNAAPKAQFRSLREVERQYVENVLRTVGGRVQVAAKILDVPRSSLYHKLKQYRSERTDVKYAS